MKNILLVMLILPVVAFAQVFHRGHSNSDGSYSQGHFQSSPNNTTSDNYSTFGNQNPYTGSNGTIHTNSEAYGNHDIQTGSRGGHYYINSHGNKTYVPQD